MFTDILIWSYIHFYIGNIILQHIVNYDKFSLGDKKIEPRSGCAWDSFRQYHILLPNQYINPKRRITFLNSLIALGVRQDTMCHFQPICGHSQIGKCVIQTGKPWALSGLYGDFSSAGTWRNNRDLFPLSCLRNIFGLHRLVVKADLTSITKIWPVFKCSIRTIRTISLNEGAYKGVNHMSDLWELTVSFRANNHVVLADIMEAFLVIRL